MRPSDSRFCRITRHAAASVSANTQRRAPRESASSPSAPEPAKRSSTEASSTGPTRLKSASRTRSPVGRVCSPFGAAILRPRCVPAMIRIAGAYVASTTRRRARPRRGAARRRPARNSSPAPVVGELLRALEQVAVGAQPREAEVGQARLSRADELPLAADLEVALGQLEAVGRRDHRLEPLRSPSRRARRGGARRGGSTTAPPRARPGRGAGGAGRARSGRPPGRS